MVLKEIQGAKEGLRYMKPMHDKYLMIRERFLNVFIRDVLKWGSSKNPMEIRSGESLAHEGDCVHRFEHILERSKTR